MKVDLALTNLSVGRAIVLLADDEPSGRATLFAAASGATASTLDPIMRLAGGRPHLALSAERCEELALEPLGDGGDLADRRPLFTATIDARRPGPAPGSVAGQLRTIEVALDQATRPADLLRGGHVSPVCARRDGLAAYPGAVEAAIELAQVATGIPAAIVTSVHAPGGAYATGPDLTAFLRRHGLCSVGIADVLASMQRDRPLVESVVSTSLPTPLGNFAAVGYRSLDDGREHMALVRGEVDGRGEVPLHIHRRCLLGDVFGSLACDCSAQLQRSLEEIERHDLGVLVYLASPAGSNSNAADWCEDADRVAARLGDPAERRLERHRAAAIAAQVLADLGAGSALLAPGPVSTGDLARHGVELGWEGVEGP